VLVEASEGVFGDAHVGAAAGLGLEHVDEPSMLLGGQASVDNAPCWAILEADAPFL
jgi:hypothetical protein